MSERAEVIGGVEAGGTKFRCAVGTRHGDLIETLTVPTTTPEETLGRVVDFFASERTHHVVRRIGVGSFGPLDLSRNSPTFGHITNTPKTGWEGVDIPGILRDALSLTHTAIDTDVNAACLAEWMWGAGQNLGVLCYVTIGTGIGAGLMINGQCHHGLVHPEFGHLLIPRDPRRDSFTGSCPYHRACLEGLAGGQALEARWGAPPSTLDDDHPAWQLESDYVAMGLANLALVLSPQRIIVGGGIAQRLPIGQLRARVSALLGGYVDSPHLSHDLATYIVRPSLRGDSGVLGAIALALDDGTPREASGASDGRLKASAGRPPEQLA